MPPTCLVMTKKNDTSHLIVRNTPPKGLVRIVLKQIRVILNKEFHGVEEPISIILSSTFRYPTKNWVVHNVSIPRVRVDYI